MSSCYTNGNYDHLLYKGISRHAMSVIHRHLEVGVAPSSSYPVTLEIGAGEGQHLPYVRHNFEIYFMLDIRSSSSPVDRPNVIRLIADAEELPFADATVDRLLTTCVLHHLTYPEKSLEEWRRVTRKGGLLSLTVATDPGVIQRSIRTFTTARRAQQLGVDYRIEIAREHRNHAASIMSMVEHVFRKDTVRYFGFPFPWKTWNFNATSTYVIRKN